jgi:hypothetical protein
MQDNRRNVGRFLGLGISRTAFFAILTAAVGTMLVLSMFFGPSSSTKVSAAQADRSAVSADALAVAFNFRSAGGFTVFGGNDLRVSGERMNVKGTSGSPALDKAMPESVRSDLRDGLNMINQLPCNPVDSADLGGKSFGPGVYCLSSASLAGAMTLDAAGDSNAVFVFRIAGDFNAANGASVNLANGARAFNAYFVSSKTTIGAGSSIDASLISDGDVMVNDGSSVTGRTISVNGDVIASNSILGQDPGFIEVCKDLAAGETVIAPGTIFTFNVAGRTIQVPAGGCSGPLQVDSGNVVVTEAFRADTIVTDIRTTLGNGTPAPERLVSSSLALRTATVVVPAGTAANETIVRFTNATSRTGVIEICKNGLDLDVTGPWTFTIPGNLQPGAPATVTVFTGFCSGPITVQLPSQVATGQLFNVTVRELGRSTFIFDPNATTTLPNGRLVSSVLNADNGGTVVIQVVAGGTTVNQTTVFFNNRSLPGRIKVCKITADPSLIPVGTRFQFTISGMRTVGGDVLSETLEVRAGPADQGGFCSLSAFNYVVGTAVRVTENSVTASDLPVGITPDMIRISNVTSTDIITGGTLFYPPSGVLPNPYGFVDTRQRNALTSVTFTNFVYRPAILKICKTTSGSIPAGTVFNFTVQGVDPGVQFFGNPTINVTVAAGNCTFANGAFPPTTGFAGIGTFNLGTRYTVTEAATGNTVVTAITSPTACSTNPPDLIPDLPNRRASFLLCRAATAGLFNEITFNNAPPAAPTAAARFDFDGDRRSDPVIFRPASGTWWFASSANGGQFRASQFGQAGDRLVAADYDGDGTADYAVYRGDGNWYVLRSSGGVASMNFGLATDIPQPGDYDGDGKADFAVYRPSNGGWYIWGTSSGFRAFQFGISTDVPQAADYDGDGSMDAAVYRSGVWYIMGSRDGFSAFQFGIASDRPVPADYDGDGKADAAVYRDGVWHVLRSSAGYMAYAWGLASDMPVPADYDGDHKADMAVYRGSNNTWFITQSGSSASGGYSALQFGSDGDVLMNY